MTTTKESPATKEPQAPSVDWLELFFDLVFVVIIKQLTDRLHGGPGAADFARVVLLFAVAWSAWMNVTTSVNLSGDRTRDRRLPVLVSMVGVGLIGVSIPEATAGSAALFVVGLAVARIAIWPLWIQVTRGVRHGWIRATVYGPGIAALWLATLLVPQEVRPFAWIALIGAELAYSASSYATAKFTVPHLLERAGLFVMIVLGESVVELIQSIHAHQTPMAWAVSAMAFVLICALWWHHYQVGTPLAERMLAQSSGTVLRDVIVVAHFFIVLGLIGIAAGLGTAIEHADDSRLPYSSVIALGAGIGAYHLGNVIIAWRYGIPFWDNVVVALPGAVALIALVSSSGGWPAWITVLVALAYMAANRFTGPWSVRRLLAGTTTAPTP